MEKVCFLLLFVLSFTFSNNTQSFKLKQNDPKIGDVLVVNSPSNNTYNHINFPQLNIIAKRGLVANYKSVYGKHVVIKKIINNKDGNTLVIIKPYDKSRFFGFLKQVEANYTKSINSGELSKVN